MRRVLRHIFRYLRVTKGDLIQHRPRHAGKVLLHTADAGSALLIRNGRNVHAANGDRTGLRTVKPQQKLEHGAFSRARPADQRDVLALPYGHGKVPQNGLFPVAEGHVGQYHVPPDGGFPPLRDDALRLTFDVYVKKQIIEKLIDSVNTCNC